jgi:AraC-like DNA-binding protein
VALALFLPPPSIERVRRLLPTYELRVAHCWKDLNALIEKKDVEATMFDPSANGLCNTREALSVLSKHPSTPAVAYVQLTPQNLKAVFALSKRGLQHVFVHPVSQTDMRLRNALERSAGHRMALELLASIDTKTAVLPPGLICAVIDLFERPNRYDTAADIADEAGISVKRLYREFSAAGLRTPKNIITFAKVVGGYGYLRFSDYPIPCIARKLGYNDSRIFCDHTVAVFGYSAEEVRKGPDSEELVLRLIEWLYKPTQLERAFKRSLALDARYDSRSRLLKTPGAAGNRNEHPSVRSRCG